MKLNTPYKTVLFYGHVLRVGKDKKYIAANKDGSLWAHRNKPALGQHCWYSRDCSASQTSVTVTFESSDHWENTLTYCEGDGQEWMLTLKTKIAVEYALLQSGAILQEKALCNVMEALPFDTALNDDQWDGFRKHSGVENVAGKEFLDALKAKMKTATMRYIEAEKVASLEDDSRLVRDYYGGELVIPTWVRFIAMDSDGMTWGYKEKPEADMEDDTDGEWKTGCTDQARRVGWRSTKLAVRVWRDSLREVQQ